MKFLLGIVLLLVTPYALAEHMIFDCKGIEWRIADPDNNKSHTFLLHTDHIRIENTDYYHGEILFPDREQLPMIMYYYGKGTDRVLIAGYFFEKDYVSLIVIGIGNPKLPFSGFLISRATATDGFCTRLDIGHD